jgi:hypothetical protein
MNRWRKEMAEKKKNRRGLIYYASVTGNTDKIAVAFKGVFEKFGWQCDMMKISKHTDIKNLPYKAEDYDLVMIGSPIWAGMPTKEIFDDHAGILMTDRLLRNGPRGGFSSITEPYSQKKAVVFVTYGGDRRGPPEALVALAGLELRLEDMRIKCIGKFACAGGSKWSRTPVDTVANTKKIPVGEAAAAISRFRDNPTHPEFASLSEQDRRMFETAVKQTRELPIDPEVEGSRGMHWDIHSRPNARDILKAEIFLSEILEDFFGGDVEAAPLGQYLCIA